MCGLSNIAVTSLLRACSGTRSDRATPAFVRFWLVAHAIRYGFFTFSAHRALKLCMARSGAGLGPGLVRVIGRTRPWPGLAWGEPHGVPQHSSVDPPNTINHRGARGMQGPPPKSSHTATRRLPPRQSATGPTSLGARLAALGRAQHLEAMRYVGRNRHD